MKRLNNDVRARYCSVPVVKKSTFEMTVMCNTSTKKRGASGSVNSEFAGNGKDKVASLLLYSLYKLCCNILLYPMINAWISSVTFDYRSTPGTVDSTSTRSRGKTERTIHVLRV